MKKTVFTACAALTIGSFLAPALASASPAVDAIANSTCTYPQVIAAVNAEAPETAAELNSSPLVNMWLQGLMAASPDERRAKIAEVSGYPQMQQYAPVINQVAYSCNNY